MSWIENRNGFPADHWVRRPSEGELRENESGDSSSGLKAIVPYLQSPGSFVQGLGKLQVKCSARKALVSVLLL